MIIVSSCFCGAEEQSGGTAYERQGCMAELHP